MNDADDCRCYVCSASRGLAARYQAVIRSVGLRGHELAIAQDGVEAKAHRDSVLHALATLPPETPFDALMAAAASMEPPAVPVTDPSAQVLYTSVLGLLDRVFPHAERGDMGGVCGEIARWLEEEQDAPSTAVRWEDLAP